MPNIANVRRTTAALLTLSAIGGAVLIGQEGFAPAAMIPVKGDRPTYGVGATFKEDGSPVQMGDTITLSEALALMQRQVRTEYEAGLKRCLDGVRVTQGEYDALVDASYNLGSSVVCSSGMVRKLKAGDYAGSCQFYLKYKYSQGRDCSLPRNKRVCGGVWSRRICEVAMCSGDNPLPPECKR